MRFALLAFLALAILPVPLAMAHETTEEPFHLHSPSDYLPIDPFPLVVGAMAFILVLSVFSVVLQNRLEEIHKKIIFVIVALAAISVTLYAAATTVYLNTVSES